jgi:hypothetical protein
MMNENKGNKTNKKSSTKKISSKHKVRVMWKWAVAFYLIAWSFTFASITSFFSLLDQEQMCQTGLIFGMSIWRTIVIILSVFITPVALFLELLFNKIPIYFVQIFLTLIYFSIYVGWTALQSILMSDAVYGQHLSYRDYTPSHTDISGKNVSFFNWSTQYAKYEGDNRSLSRVAFCRDYYISENIDYKLPEKIIKPNFEKTFTTLGVMLGSVIFGHLFLWLVTRFIKKNSKPIVGYSSDLEELEVKLTSPNQNPKDVIETKEKIEEIAREMRENKR